MKRALVSTVVVLLFLGFARTAAAQSSTPTIDAFALGIELCPQSICGAAIFVGGLAGEVDNEDSAGIFLAAITHDDLPDPGQSAAITGGAFALQFGTDSYEGLVPAGLLVNNGDGTYGVLALVVVNDAILLFEGILDHNFFPPLIYGRLHTLVGADNLTAAGGR